MSKKSPTKNAAWGRPKGSTQRKIPNVDPEQSARFIEAARTAGAAKGKKATAATLKRIIEKSRDHNN